MEVEIKQVVMHVDTFEEVLYPETLATDMLDLAAVILVNGLHDQFDQQRRFASQLLQIDVQRIIGAVTASPPCRKSAISTDSFTGSSAYLTLSCNRPRSSVMTERLLSREKSRRAAFTRSTFSVPSAFAARRSEDPDRRNGWPRENHMHGFAERTSSA